MLTRTPTMELRETQEWEDELARHTVLDLGHPAELREVIALLVDAMRRSDPDYTQAHGCEQCSDDDWNMAIQAGEDCLEASQNVCLDCQGKRATAPNGVQYCGCD